jgi:hypothetical protein
MKDMNVGSYIHRPFFPIARTKVPDPFTVIPYNPPFRFRFKPFPGFFERERPGIVQILGTFVPDLVHKGQIIGFYQGKIDHILIICL